MAKTVPFVLKGGPALYQTLGELTRPTQRNALMRTLKQEIQPLADAVKAATPVKFGDLEGSEIVGTKLTKRQRSLDRRAAEGPATATLHFGTADPAGMMEEFGLGNNPIHSYFRPEWEARKMSILEGIGNTLGDEIVSAGVRAARRNARGTAGSR